MNYERTHWSECWRDPAHHECAVAEIELMLAALRAVSEAAAIWPLPNHIVDDVRAAIALATEAQP